MFKHSGEEGSSSNGSDRGVTWAGAGASLDVPARMRTMHPPCSTVNENGEPSSASCSYRTAHDPSESLARSVLADGQSRTLRARVSWRTELFQEVLGRCDPRQRGHSACCSFTHLSTYTAVNSGGGHRCTALIIVAVAVGDNSWGKLMKMLALLWHAWECAPECV